MICGNEDGNAISPVNCGGLDANADGTGNANGNANGTGNGHSPLLCGNANGNVMPMTMVMECHSPFGLWEVCTYRCIVTCGSLIPFTIDL